MARAKKKASTNHLADIAAGNLDRAIGEIEGTVAALKHVTSTRSENAIAQLERATRLISEARDLTIETFEQDY